VTYDEALKLLPAGAVWSSSFGYPGEGGYTEFHRLPSGERWRIENGPYDAMKPFEWTCEKVATASRATVA
jgi:predicted glycosyl hydrolase (DUF1957 family)